MLDAFLITANCDDKLKLEVFIKNMIDFLSFCRYRNK